MKTRSHVLKASAVVLAIAFPSVAHTYPDAPNQFSAGGTILADDMNDNFQHVVDGISGVERGVVPIGSVVSWAGVAATVPAGWLLCDGAEYQIAEYPDLSAAIGSAHGGDGATAFHVPDLRGRFVRGVDDGEGRDPDATDRTQPQEGSGNAGDAVGSVQTDAFGAHVHGTAINFPGNMASEGPYGSGSAGVLPDTIWGSQSGSAAAQNSEEVGGNESRPENAYLHFIIRAE